MSEDISGTERRPLSRRRLSSLVMALVLLAPDPVSAMDISLNESHMDMIKELNRGLGSSSLSNPSEDASSSQGSGERRRLKAPRKGVPASRPPTVDLSDNKLPADPQPTTQWALPSNYTSNSSAYFSEESSYSSSGEESSEYEDEFAFRTPSLGGLRVVLKPNAQSGALRLHPMTDMPSMIFDPNDIPARRPAPYLGKLPKKPIPVKMSEVVVSKPVEADSEKVSETAEILPKEPVETVDKPGEAFDFSTIIGLYLDDFKAQIDELFKEGANPIASSSIRDGLKLFPSYEEPDKKKLKYFLEKAGKHMNYNDQQEIAHHFVNKLKAPIRTSWIPLVTREDILTMNLEKLKAEAKGPNDAQQKKKGGALHQDQKQDDKKQMQEQQQLEEKKQLQVQEQQKTVQVDVIPPKPVPYGDKRPQEVPQDSATKSGHIEPTFPREQNPQIEVQKPIKVVAENVKEPQAVPESGHKLPPIDTVLDNKIKPTEVREAINTKPVIGGNKQSQHNLVSPPAKTIMDLPPRPPRKAVDIPIPNPVKPVTPILPVIDVVPVVPHTVTPNQQKRPPPVSRNTGGGGGNSNSSGGSSKRTTPSTTPVTIPPPVRPSQTTSRRQRTVNPRIRRLALWTMCVVVVGFSLLGFGMYQLAAFDPVVF